MTQPGGATPELEPWRRALASSLEPASDPAVRDHWDAYLRGAARFRGVPMAGIRRAVRATLRQGLAELDHAAKLSVALDWLAQPWSEDKLAGVLLIAEHLAPALDDADVGGRCVSCRWPSRSASEASSTRTRSSRARVTGWPSPGSRPARIAGVEDRRPPRGVAP
jgi:hypothetical protein